MGHVITVLAMRSLLEDSKFIATSALGLLQYIVVVELCKEKKLASHRFDVRKAF